MTTVRRINQSQVRGNNDGVLPAGTIMVYEVNGEYRLRVHNGVTLGGVPFPNAPSIVHNDDVNIIINGGDSSTYTWNFGQTGTLTAPGMAVFGGTDGIVVDNLNNGIAALFNNGDVYITGGESLRFTGLDNIEGESSAVLRFWNGEGRHSSGNDATELVTLNVGNDADSGDPTLGFFKIITEKQVGGEKEWKFDADGVLTLPTGGDIVDENGDSVLGGGASDSNVWVQTFETQNGAPTDIVSLAMSVEYDDAGNVIALFNHFNDDGGGSYYSVGKYTTTGAKIWTARFDDEFYTDGWGLAVDNDSNSIYVAGETDVEGQDNATLTKLDSTDGSVLWSKIYDFGFSSQSSVVDVASDGDPVMVGYAYNGTDNYVATTKVDAADGSIIWSRALDGQADEEAYGMAVGPSGEVVAIGYMSQLGVSDGVATLYADSNPNWTGGGTTGTSNGVTFSVTVTDGVATFSNISDTIGNRSVDEVIATINGSIFGGETVSLLTQTTYPETFNEQQVVGIRLVGDHTDKVGCTISGSGLTGNMLIVDTDPLDPGDPNAGPPIPENTIVYVVADWSSITLQSGTDYNITPPDMVVKVGTLATNEPDDRMLVVKYDSAGSIQWQKAILFDAGFDCYGADADIDSDGNIYVTGSYRYDSGEQFSTTSALSILKLDGNGAKQWSRRVTGTCDTFGISVVVGADDKLYLSGVTGFAGGNTDTNNGYTWVAAKYGIDGTVEWQRLIDNTTGWTFTGGLFFGSGGGSNIAVKENYVLLGGGFGDFENSGDPLATVVQVSATGDVFSVGDWDFKAASFSGVLNSSASDITVVNAGKTDTDNAENITTGTVTLTTEVSGFLIGTLYSTTANNRLFNGSNELVLGTTGTVTLPQGGTITEGYVTSNPTIQLTPATPSVASQKLVIKGGGNYSNTENGITVTLNNITQIVGDVVNVYVEAPTRVGQTLYWWIYPESAGLADPGTGTVILDEIGDGLFTFTLDSDDYEFNVRISPEDNNYDPANIGVESVLVNGDAPTFEGDHHLHLTTGDLSETSIFLGTDDHNVRTTVDGGISMTTTRGTVLFGNTPDNPVTASSHFHIMKDSPDIVDLFFGDDDNYVKLPSTQGVEVSANGSSWTFGTDGALTIPGDIKSENAINIDINLSDSTLRRWSFGEDGDLTFPDNTVQTTAYTGSTLTTVAKTGIAYNTGTATALEDSTYIGSIVDGNYGPFTLSGVTFTVVVTSGVAAYTVTATTGNTAVGAVIGTLDTGDLGGTSGSTSNISVADVVQGVTAIDLTKTINKLTDGYYYLADGVEGQIMYVVRQNGSTAANIFVLVANARWDGTVYSEQPVIPFQIPFTDMVTIIFTDGAWQSSTFGSLT